MLGLILGLGLPALASVIGVAVLGPGPAFALVKRIPPKVWLALAVVALIIVAGIWHQRHAKAELQAAYDRGVADEREANRLERERLRAKADRIRQGVETLQAKISNQLKDTNNAENRRIAAAGDDLRLRGPGKAAACPGPGGSAGLPDAAGRHDQAGAARNDAGRRLSEPDRLAVVPWGWLVSHAEGCDLNRQEVLTWRDWYAQQSVAWARYRAQLQAAADPKKGSQR